MFSALLIYAKIYALEAQRTFKHTKKYILIFKHVIKHGILNCYDVMNMMKKLYSKALLASLSELILKFQEFICKHTIFKLDRTRIIN